MNKASNEKERKKNTKTHAQSKPSLTIVSVDEFVAS